MPHTRHPYPSRVQQVREPRHERADGIELSLRGDGLERGRADGATLTLDHGILAVSGNVPTALAALTRDTAHPPACCVFSYGCLLDLDGATDVADAARQFGFEHPLAGHSVADLRSDVPVLIVRAGRDQFPAMNASIDRFVAHALAANLPISLINYAAGSHAFDLFDASDAARSVLRQQLTFLRECLQTG